MMRGGPAVASEVQQCRKMGDEMTDERKSETGWTAAERQALRRLIRMGLILLLAIVIAGTIAALLSSALGTV